MNAPLHSPMRRGACPGLSAPMATGDGLLARLTPSGATIALSAFSGLCTAAARHGNGIVEITSRGSIQVRGLTAATPVRLRQTSPCSAFRPRRASGDAGSLVRPG